MGGQEADIAAAFAGSRRNEFDFGGTDDTSVRLDEFFVTHRLDHSISDGTSGRAISVGGESPAPLLRFTLPPGFDTVRDASADERASVDYHKELAYAWRKTDPEKAAEHFDAMYQNIGQAAMKERAVLGVEQNSPFVRLRTTVLSLVERGKTRRENGDDLSQAA